ncbi:RHS repeat-associated core domain-containing protein [Streptomyces cellulosae]
MMSFEASTPTMNEPGATTPVSMVTEPTPTRSAGQSTAKTATRPRWSSIVTATLPPPSHATVGSLSQTPPIDERDRVPLELLGVPLHLLPTWCYFLWNLRIPVSRCPRSRGSFRVSDTVTTGAPASTPSYTGARYETTTGNLDLHARQYNTSTGRFNRPDPAVPDRSSPYVSAYAYANNTPTLYTDPSGMTPVPGDNGNGKVDNLGEGLKIFGNGYLQGLKAPFEFLGDAQDAVTGENGGAGAFIDKYLPVRPAYRLYRAESMLRQQGCDALADLYADAADELAQQIAVVGIGGLTGWRRAAVEPDISQYPGEAGSLRRYGPGGRG